ncbi:PD-(D/E)XK nuclease superfamily protein [Natronincola peptidivorans]|uniref:PD-(D/E)XK nuclease superfamily protein n=1 Tax=Natronincola peptidivorans TaxID=426128 RepID=A0A1I0E028_9FIRM|nr:nuclease domain-containing protein [Natronincola peptidivorans]SET37491.1 PD-(D/E)XK nuclease superfamily protein [Natronincola peptidivorans]
MNNNDYSRFLKGSLDLIITDNMQVREFIDDFFDKSLQEIDPEQVNLNYILWAIKGIDMVSHLYPKKGIYFIRNIIDSLKYTRQKSYKYSKHLIGGKLDKKYVSRLLKSGKDINKIQEFRLIVKEKNYDDYYNLYFAASLMTLVKDLQGIIKDANNIPEVKELKVYKKIYGVYLKLIHLLNDEIIQDLVLQVKGDINQKHLQLMMQKTYKKLPKEYRVFYTWFNKFKNKEKYDFLKLDSITVDKVFEYYVLKSIKLFLEKNNYQREKQRFLMYNSKGPIFEFINGKSKIDVYFQNSSQLKTGDYIQIRYDEETEHYKKTKPMTGIPDVILVIKKEAARKVILMDAKYKTNFDNSNDRYKMLGYLKNFKLEDAPCILLYYNKEIETVSNTTKLYINKTNNPSLDNNSNAIEIEELNLDNMVLSHLFKELEDLDKDKSFKELFNKSLTL